jgi:N-acetylmuramoyl-L-alanine amidase CwlA
MNIKNYMKKLDELANLWNNTKDPQHKIKWYKGVEELSFLLASSQVKSKVDNQTLNKSRIG